MPREFPQVDLEHMKEKVLSITNENLLCFSKLKKRNQYFFEDTPVLQQKITKYNLVF